MKTKILSIIAVTVMLMMSSVVKAENDVYNNTVYDDFGRPLIVETFINYAEGNMQPLKKQTLKYDENGYCSEKIFFVWSDSDNSWTEQKKVECKYNKGGQMTLMVTLSWDKKKSDWTESSKAEYKYDVSGNLIS